MPSDLTIVIPTMYAGPHLDACLEALYAAISHASCRATVVIIDNAAPPGEVQRAAHRHGATVVRRATNGGFAEPMTQAMSAADSEWVVALNDDTEVEPDWLSELWSAITARQDAWAFSTRLVFHARPSLVASDGVSVDVAARPADLHGGQPVAELSSTPFEIFGASAGAAAYHRRTFIELGGFPAEFFAYYEDVDLAWRARRQGLITLCVPRAVARHHGQGSSRRLPAYRARLSARNYLWLVARNVRSGEWSGVWLRMVTYQAAYLVMCRRQVLHGTLGTIDGVRGWRAQRRQAASWRAGSAPLHLEPYRGLRESFRARRYRDLVQRNT